LIKLSPVVTNCWRQLVSDHMWHQEVAAQYPEIPLSTFQRAVQYIAPDGKIARGAEAGVLTLSHAGGKGFWLTSISKVHV
jgi:hypothetical protein